MTRRAGWLLVLGVLLVPAADAQAVLLPEIVEVRVGFAGHYKVGLWTPVEVTLGGRAGAGEVRLTLPDGDGVPSRVSAFLAEGDTSVLLYARFGRIESRLVVELRTDEGVVSKTFETAEGTSFPPAKAATRKMIVGVGPDPVGLKDAVRLLRQRGHAETIVARLEDIDQLPDQWYGYESVDTLVLSTGRLEIWRLTAEQAVALDEWIRMGGRLVLSVGSRAEEIMVGGLCLLDWFVPGKLQEMVDLRQTRALETYASSSIAIPQPPGGARLVLRVPLLGDVEGIVRASEARLPLVVVTPRGFGQIVFLAADLDRPPLSNWTDRPKLLSTLLGLPADRPDESEDRSGRMHYGYHDMSGQLRSALDQFRGSDVWVVPFWVVAALIVGYILLIGPGDYFFLRKFTRRMEWTWVTFPAIVLGVSLAACGLAYYFKGDRVRVNQADLVDVDAASGYVRGTSWINLFGRARLESYNLSLQPRLPGGADASDHHDPRQADVVFSWLGLPGEALGGMNPRTSNPVLWTEPYDFSRELSQMDRVPIPVWSTRSFTARWSAQAKVGLEADLVDEGSSLRGTITNQLGFVLSDCTLAYDRYAYQLGTLKPGADRAVRIDATVERSGLRTWLTERKFLTDEKRLSYYEKAPEYDQSSVKVPYVLRAMMFYEAAGGRQYTGLSHGYQSFVDLSSLLETERALLVAWAPAGHRAADLLRDGRPITRQEDRHTTVYRVVFPVKQADGKR